MVSVIKTEPPSVSTSLRFLVESKMGMKNKRRLIDYDNAYEKLVEKEKLIWLGCAFTHRKKVLEFLIFTV